jgi:hypothetical protein
MVISSRNRNLGYGWTNGVVQDGDHLRIAYENIPCMAQGGIATVLRERAAACRINSGNDWAEALFVGGKRITAWYGRVRRRGRGNCSRLAARRWLALS